MANGLNSEEMRIMTLPTLLRSCDVTAHCALKGNPLIRFAGQLSGVEGYMESAASGILAGKNLARQLQGKPPLILTRDMAYIGVLTDDLTRGGYRTDLTREPFRMFTSRCEYRLSVRAVGERRRREA